MLAALEMRQGRLDEEDGASKIDLELFVPGLRGELSDGHGEAGCCVVDHNVDATETFDCGGNESIERSDVPHMCGHTECIASPKAAQMGFGLGAGISLAAGHHHIGPRADEPFGDGAADTAGAAGDDGGAAGEIEQRVELGAVHRLIVVRAHNPSGRFRSRLARRRDGGRHIAVPAPNLVLLITNR